MILIENKTKENYKEIGTIIDNINNHNKGKTNYYGKCYYCVIQTDYKHYKVTIKTLKKYTKYVIEEEK